MKRKLILPLLFLAMISYAQKKEKEEQIFVEYKVFTKRDLGDKFKGKKDIQDAWQKAFNKPTYMELKLNKYESTYVYIPSISNNQTSDEIRISINPYGDQGIMYRNLKDSIQLIEKKVDDQAYLVKDTLINIDWQLTREKKNVCGFETRKATLIEKDSTEVIAWYAPSITWANGPDNYYGLPGLILEIKQIRMSDGTKWEKDCVCNKLEIIAKPKKLKKPEKGEEISQAELKELYRIRAEKLKELNGGKGNVIIQTIEE